MGKSDPTLPSRNFWRPVAIGVADLLRAQVDRVGVKGTIPEFRCIQCGLMRERGIEGVVVSNQLAVEVGDVAVKLQ